jgi:hypothetical protein
VRLVRVNPRSTNGSNADCSGCLEEGLDVVFLRVLLLENSIKPYLLILQSLVVSALWSRGVLPFREDFVLPSSISSTVSRRLRATAFAEIHPLRLDKTKAPLRFEVQYCRLSGTPLSMIMRSRLNDGLNTDRSKTPSRSCCAEKCVVKA